MFYFILMNDSKRIFFFKKYSISDGFLTGFGRNVLTDFQPLWWSESVIYKSRNALTLIRILPLSTKSPPCFIPVDLDLRRSPPPFCVALPRRSPSLL